LETGHFLFDFWEHTLWWPFLFYIVGTFPATGFQLEYIDLFMSPYL